MDGGYHGAGGAVASRRPSHWFGNRRSRSINGDCALKYVKALGMHSIIIKHVIKKTTSFGQSVENVDIYLFYRHFFFFIKRRILANEQNTQTNTRFLHSPTLKQASVFWGLRNVHCVSSVPSPTQQDSGPASACWAARGPAGHLV